VRVLDIYQQQAAQAVMVWWHHQSWEPWRRHSHAPSMSTHCLDCQYLLRLEANRQTATH